MMPFVTVDEWRKKEVALTLVVNAEDVYTTFKRKFKIPPSTVGLVLSYESPTKKLLYFEGEELRGNFSILLVKTNKFQVEFKAENLKSKDNFNFQIELLFDMQLETDKPELLREFYKNIVRGQRVCNISSIKAFLEPMVMEFVKEFVASKSADELYKPDIFQEFVSFLTGEENPRLKNLLFGTGISFLYLSKAEFESEDYKQHQELKKQEAVDREKIKIREKIMREVFNDEQLAKLLSTINDPEIRDSIYAILISENIEQIDKERFLGKFKDERIRVRIGQVLDTILVGELEQVSPLNIPHSYCEGIYIVGSRKLLHFSGDKLVKEKEYPQPLRSVRVIRDHEGKTIVLVGGKTEVYLCYEDDKMLIYQITYSGEPKGGINSTCVYGDFIFASHSEIGVIKWRKDKPEKDILVFKDITKTSRVTRAIQVFKDRIYFSSDGKIISFAPDREDDFIIYQATGNVRIYSFTLCDKYIFAGTEDGKLLQWEISEPNKSQIITERGKAMCVRLTRIGTLSHLLYSTMSKDIFARVIGTPAGKVYEAEGINLGVMDASSDLICALDETGYMLIIWQTTSPESPKRIDLWKHINRSALDLIMLKRYG